MATWPMVAASACVYGHYATQPPYQAKKATTETKAGYFAEGRQPSFHRPARSFFDS